MKTKTIWLLLDSSSVGGIETHVLQLAIALKKYNFDVSVIFLNKYSFHPMTSDLDNLNIPYHFLNGLLVSLNRFVCSKRPDIIHTHGYKAGIWGRLIGFKKSIKVVSTFHAGETPKGKVFYYDFVDRYTAFLADEVMTVSNKVAKKLPCKSLILDNFIDASSVTISFGQDIAFVGRLSSEKGPDFIIKLAQKMPHINFHMYGDGEMATPLKEIAGKNIIFHGAKDRMNEHWLKIGLVLMPSRYEGLPMVSLEAMARGIPLIAFNVGALDKVIDSENNGWLVEAGDISGMQHALEEWLDLSDRAKRYIKIAAADSIQEKFSIEARLPDILKVYA